MTATVQLVTSSAPAINNATEENIWENACLSVMYRKEKPNDSLTAITEADVILNAFKSRRGKK